MAPRSRSRSVEVKPPFHCWVVARDMTRLIVEIHECHGTAEKTLYEVKHRLSQEGWLTTELKFSTFFASRGTERVLVAAQHEAPGHIGTRD